MRFSVLFIYLNQLNENNEREKQKKLKMNNKFIVQCFVDHFQFVKLF